MKRRNMFTILFAILAVIICPNWGIAEPLGTAFTYQGHLYDNNDVADGLYDFQFKLYADPCDSNQVGGDVNKPDVNVIDGYFNVALDFGSGVFDGNAVWLEIGVRPGELEDPNAYTTLSPRQEVTPVPYALQTRGIFVDSGGDVGIGTTSPDEKLHVAGSVKIVDGNQGAGKVLTSNANGVASWQTSASPAAVPSGVIVMWSGSIASIPSGWVLCDGSNGTPDLRDKFIVGARQDDGGVAKTNVKGSLMQTGGEHEHTLTIAELAAHTHTQVGHKEDYYTQQGCEGSQASQTCGETASTGGGQAHENTPPFYALAYIMKI